MGKQVNWDEKYPTQAGCFYHVIGNENYLTNTRRLFIRIYTSNKF